VEGGGEGGGFEEVGGGWGWIVVVGERWW
jgi:hypothetical protein